jgi:hypothetical protein
MLAAAAEVALVEGDWGEAWEALAAEVKGSRPRRGPPPTQLVAAWQARLQGGRTAQQKLRLCRQCTDHEKAPHMAAVAFPTQQLCTACPLTGADDGAGGRVDALPVNACRPTNPGLLAQAQVALLAPVHTPAAPQ